MFAEDYTNVTVTGAGIAVGDNRMRFTIDATPNNVWLTDEYTGEDLNRLVSLVIAAYLSGKKVAFIRTNDNPDQSTYIRVTMFEVGSIVHN